MHVFVKEDELAIDEEQTGWSQGGTGIEYEVAVARSGPGREGQPSDYEITFANSPVTTGFNNNLPLPFRVVNLTQANLELDVFVPDLNRNNQWDVGEQIVFLEQVDGRLTATWQLALTDSGNAPGNGDVFFVSTKKPFGQDVFTFSTVGATDDAQLISQEVGDCSTLDPSDPRYDEFGECIYAVPNPYVATNELEPRNPVARAQRGDRRMYFAGVPAQCTIRIFTLAGELVDTIERNSPVDDGKEFWDLRTKDNMNIAFGLYIFHVEWETGSYIGKFAVIK